jgi:hypothetical protein
MRMTPDETFDDVISILEDLVKLCPSILSRYLTYIYYQLSASSV